MAATVLVAGAVTAVAWPGSTQWTTVANPDPLSGELSTVTCAPTGQCLAHASDGQYLITRGSGPSWLVAPPVANASYASIPICSFGGCAVLESTGVSLFQSFYSTGPDPQIVDAQSIPDEPAILFQGASCVVADEFCMVVSAGDSNPSDHEYTFTEQGPELGFTVVSHYIQPLRDENLLASTPEAPGCATATICEAASETGLWRTTNGGVTWKLQVAMGPSDPDALAVACPTTHLCLATLNDGQLMRTTDGGLHWSTLTIGPWATDDECAPTDCLASSDQFVAATTVTCVSATYCLIGGTGDTGDGPVADGTPPNSGAIAVSTDGGVTWRSQSIPSNVDITSISCVRVGECWAVGRTTAESNPSGVIVRLS
jgi:hypothetical protein